MLLRPYNIYSKCHNWAAVKMTEWTNDWTETNCCYFHFITTLNSNSIPELELILFIYLNQKKICQDKLETKKTCLKFSKRFEMSWSLKGCMPYNQSIDLKLKQLGVRVHLLRKGCFYFILGGAGCIYLFIWYFVIIFLGFGVAYFFGLFWYNF